MPRFMVNGKNLDADLLLFDLDGTLVDDEDRYKSLAALRFNAIEARAGRHAAETWAPFGGYDPVTRTIDMAGPIAKAARKEDMAVAAAGIYRTGKEWHEARALAEAAYADADAVQMRDYIPRFFPGVEKSLRKLKAQGFTLGIVTNGSNKITSQLVEILKVADLFAVIAGSEDAANPKPAPDILLAACGKAGKQPKSVVYVGDQVVDAEAAKAAGCAGCVIVGRATVPQSPYVQRLSSVADLAPHP